jgi:hypothetical protein
MTDRKTFCAFGAYVTNVMDPHATVVLPLANASELGNLIDDSRTVTLNLSQRLGAFGVAFADAMLDTLGMEMNNNTVVEQPMRPAFPDDFGINVLTIGPVFPGAHVGAVYIERDKFFLTPVAPARPSIRRLMDPDPTDRQWPYAGLHTYEFMSSASQDGKVLSRYHGFHATVERDDGSKKNLDFGDGKKFLIDMDDRTLCDDPDFLSGEIQDPDHPETPELVLSASSVKGAQGAIFLSLKFCVENALHSPKEPPGGGYLPRPHRSQKGELRSLQTRPAANSSPTANSSLLNSLVFANVGAPGNDSFARSVFQELTSANAQKLVIQKFDLESLRSQLMEFVKNIKGNNNSLDIVADAPQSTQQIGRATIQSILQDKDRQITLDDKLVALIREHFSQCRLIGCYTAGCNSAFPFDGELRERMRQLADLLGIPVVGTIRSIASDDFDDIAFHDTDRIGQNLVITVGPSGGPFIPHGISMPAGTPAPLQALLDPADRHAQQNVSGPASAALMKRAVRVDVDETIIASGRIQRDWLERFRQVKIEAEDLEREESMGLPIWRMEGDLLDSPVAATHVIHTSAVDNVALQTSGMRFRAEVLASGTLLRLTSKRYGSVYLNIPPSAPERGTWLSQKYPGMGSDPQPVKSTP